MSALNSYISILLEGECREFRDAWKPDSKLAFAQLRRYGLQGQAVLKDRVDARIVVDFGSPPKSHLELICVEVAEFQLGAAIGMRLDYPTARVQPGSPNGPPTAVIETEEGLRIAARDILYKSQYESPLASWEWPMF